MHLCHTSGIKGDKTGPQEAYSQEEERDRTRLMCNLVKLSKSRGGVRYRCGLEKGAIHSGDS